MACLSGLFLDLPAVYQRGRLRVFFGGLAAATGVFWIVLFCSCGVSAAGVVMAGCASTGFGMPEDPGVGGGFVVAALCLSGLHFGLLALRLFPLPGLKIQGEIQMPMRLLQRYQR